ncbi:hypothetical protein M0R45_034463 [Rubus argutus]|uniref:Uncharacterized protein n=1 Tax=Rubus argutus TaxID=59490 RepID=A0AAW1VUK3_RUBAR
MAEENTVWFDAELHAVLLLQKALGPLCQSAYTDREYPEDMFRDCKIYDTGCMSISATEGVVLSSTSSFPPYVFTYLWMPISSFRTFQCRENRVLNLNLRFLEEQITDCASINFTGETTNYNAIMCSFMKVGEDGDVLGTEECAISLISSNPATERYVSAFTSQLIIEMQSETFKNVINSVSMFGFTVHATVTNTQITFRVVNNETVLREEAEAYRTVLSAGQYPYSLKFSLHQKSAFLNAARLSNVVRLHLFDDSRTRLDVPVEGLGNLMFCFKL